jgi:hypothetical protein
MLSNFGNPNDFSSFATLNSAVSIAAGKDAGTPNGIWLASVGNGLYRSVDDGVTWQFVQAGGTGMVMQFPNDTPSQLRLAYGGNDVFVAVPSVLGGARQVTYRSDDGGLNWSFVTIDGELKTQSQSSDVGVTHGPNRRYVAFGNSRWVVVGDRITSPQRPGGIIIGF